MQSTERKGREQGDPLAAFITAVILGLPAAPVWASPACTATQRAFLVRPRTEASGFASAVPDSCVRAFYRGFSCASITHCSRHTLLPPVEATLAAWRSAISRAGSSSDTARAIAIRSARHGSRDRCASATASTATTSGSTSCATALSLSQHGRLARVSIRAIPLRARDLRVAAPLLRLPRPPATVRGAAALRAISCACCAEIDRDPHGIFWHRVNGASLRW